MRPFTNTRPLINGFATLALIASTPSTASAQPQMQEIPRPKWKIEGLVEVKSEPAVRPRWWQRKTRKVFVYRLKWGDETKLLEMPNRLRRVKDLRDYSVRCPRRHWLQEFCKRWDPVASFSGHVTQGASDPVIIPLLFKR